MIGNKANVGRGRAQWVQRTGHEFVEKGSSDGVFQGIRDGYGAESMIRKITKHCPKPTHQVKGSEDQVRLPGTGPIVNRYCDLRIYQQTAELTVLE